MSEGHRLHEAHIEGGVEPAGAFTVEERSAPDGVSLVARARPRALAAPSAVTSRRAAAGTTFVDSSMLKELLRAGAELDRYETKLVLAGIPPAVRRVLDLTRTADLFTIADDPQAALALLGG